MSEATKKVEKDPFSCLYSIPSPPSNMCLPPLTILVPSHLWAPQTGIFHRPFLTAFLWLYCSFLLILDFSMNRHKARKVLFVLRFHFSLILSAPLAIEITGICENCTVPVCFFIKELYFLTLPSIVPLKITFFQRRWSFHFYFCPFTRNIWSESGFLFGL